MWCGHPGRHCGWPSAAVVALLSLYPVESVAQAPSDPFALTWQAPEGCPDRTELTRRVEAFLGQSLEVRRAQQLKIEAVVTADSTAGFIAKLSVTTAQATYDRRLDHQDCASLTEAAALVMALAIDPERVRAREVEAGPGSDSAQPVAPDPATTDGVPPATDPPPKDVPQLAPTPAAVPASAPTPAITDARPPAEPAAPAEGKPFLIDVGVRGLLDVGTLPRAAFGVGGVVGISRGSFRLELTGAYWFPVDEPVPDHAPAKVEVQLATGGLSGCFVSAQGAWDLAACMGAELGDYRGRGVDVDDPVTEHQLWSAAVADLRVSRPLTPMLGIVGGVEPGVSITRPRFGVTQGDETFEVARPGPVFVRTYIGTKLMF